MKKIKKFVNVNKTYLFLLVFDVLTESVTIIEW